MDVKDLLLQGLLNSQKYIDISFRYDSQGSVYDQECADLEEFYHYRSEKAVIHSNVKNVVSHLDIPLMVFELGCGNTKKSQLILNEILQHQSHLDYSPNDFSKDFLVDVCQNLCTIYGHQLRLTPMPGDLMDALAKIKNYRDRKLILWLSGLQCFTMDKQFEMLSSIASVLEANDACLLTVDVTQSRELIEKAYLDYDYSKPNAKLYTNGVHVINRELGGNINLSQFKLEGRYVEDKDVSKASYNQVWLTSLCKQSYHLEKVGKTVTFEEGEKLLLYAGNGMSHKYTQKQLDHLFARARLRIIKKWENEHCALILCKRIF
ncbi:uncharacterized protein [Magallana gigas]|uniref:uncharacterized protein isoform X1 n=1 Tax=Magallana gigas TaxID=29159 RepID=UPI00333EEA3E